MSMAREMADLESLFTAELRDIAGQRKGSITIGISHMRSLVFLPEVLPEFHRIYPDVAVQLDIDVTKRLSEKLVDGEVDLVVGFNPFYKAIMDKVAFKSIIRERLCLVVPQRIMAARFPEGMAGKVEEFRDGVDLGAFAEDPFLMVAQGNRIRDMSDSVLARRGIKPRIILECVDLETLLLLCMRGMGLSFGFESVAKMHGAGFVAAAKTKAYIFPITDPEVQGTIVIGYNKTRYLSHAARGFIDLAAEIFKSGEASR